MDGLILGPNDWLLGVVGCEGTLAVSGRLQQLYRVYCDPAASLSIHQRNVGAEGVDQEFWSSPATPAVLKD